MDSTADLARKVSSYFEFLGGVVVDVGIGEVADGDDDVEDISGFIGCLSSTDSDPDERLPEPDDDESSAGQDRFNEVNEIVVRFKPQSRGPEFVNEAFEGESESYFVGSLADSDADDDDGKYETLNFVEDKPGPSIHSEHVSCKINFFHDHTRATLSGRTGQLLWDSGSQTFHGARSTLSFFMLHEAQNI